MHTSSDWNFSASLVCRLGENSCLTDAADGKTFRAHDISRLIVGLAAGFLSAGIAPGEHLLIVCGLNSSSTLAYLGAMYAGIVPVLIDERALEISGPATVMKAGGKAYWTARSSHWEWATKHKIQQISGMYELASPSNLLPAPCAENDLAALMPTSGSSGIPQLVKVTHGYLRANTEAIIHVVST